MRHTNTPWRAVTFYGVIITTMLGLIAALGGDIHAKKRSRQSGGFTLKVAEVSTSPAPFEVGSGDLTFSLTVNLPSRRGPASILEITVLITSPTQRSMRFLTQRVNLHSPERRRPGSTFSTTIAWDGNDQVRKPVDAGVYRYEVRAKLMADAGDGPRTRVVSRKTRGTIEVVKPQKPDIEPAQTPPHDTEPTSDAPSPNNDTMPQDNSVPSPAGASNAAPDEVELLLDESTGHPPRDPEDDEQPAIQDETLPAPQEG